jgi:TPR repeat protein
MIDPGEAARWYKRAAEAGDIPAMTEIGRRFESGIGVAAERSTAVSWYRQAAEKGHALAMYRLGLLTSDPLWVRKASDAGVPEAMCVVAETLDDPDQKLALFRRAADAGYINAWTRIGVATGDTSMFNRAAQLGDPEAKFRLGEIEYQRKKRREAFRLFRAAAEGGYGPAMVRVGDCHLNGDGASLSEIDAVNWYRKAALAGNQEAINKLKKLGKTQ